MFVCGFGRFTYMPFAPVILSGAKDREALGSTMLFCAFATLTIHML